jgi:hypothetical protein
MASKEHMPAEWEPHRATIMTYPHNPQVFRGKDCEPAGKEYRAVARAIAQFEDVLMMCNTQEIADMVRAKLDAEGGAERIFCHVCPRYVYFITWNDRNSDSSHPKPVCILCLPSFASL